MRELIIRGRLADTDQFYEYTKVSGVRESKICIWGRGGILLFLMKYYCLSGGLAIMIEIYTNEPFLHVNPRRNLLTVFGARTFAQVSPGGKRALIDQRHKI